MCEAFESVKEMSKFCSPSASVRILATVLLIACTLMIIIPVQPSLADSATVQNIADPDDYTCEKSDAQLQSAALEDDNDDPITESKSTADLQIIDFEDFPDRETLFSNTIEGVQFTTTGGETWRVGDFSTGLYNGKYPTGIYTSKGTNWAWLGENQGLGRIDFVNGLASEFSLLVSADLTPVSLEAYDANDNLLVTAGPSSRNTGTGHMDELRIVRDDADIAYMKVHDSGNFFLIDAICTDASSTNPPPVEDPNPELSDDFGNPSDPNAGGGDPINFLTGNMYEIREDLSLPGKGQPLKFVRTYNSQDTLQGPLGYGWTHNYNTSLRKNEDGSMTELNPQGRRLTFARNNDGSYSAPQDITDELEENADGTYTLTKKDGYKWKFGPQGYLRLISDLNGNELEFDYDDSGQMVRIVDTVGRETNLRYSSGRIASLTDPSGKVTRYGYSGGKLVSVTNPRGHVTRYTYDSNRNIVSVTNPDGGFFDFEYDDQDRAVRTSGVDGTYEMDVTYDPENNKTTVTDSKGNESVYRYNDMSRVTSVTDPYGNETSYTFDNQGNRTSSTDQLGNTMNYSYDDEGNLIEVEEPNGAITSMTYEFQFNRIESMTNAEGAQTSFAYDTRGNLTSVNDADDNETTFEPGPDGQLLSVTDARSNETSFAYDEQGNLEELTDAAGQNTTYEYDVMGRLKTETDALGRSTDYFYDAAGNLEQVTNPDGTSRVVYYDPMNRPYLFYGENGFLNYRQYDSQGNLISNQDAEGRQTQYKYDTEGNLISVTDPSGNETLLEYDALTRLTATTSPDGMAGGARVAYDYNARGDRTSVTDANGNETAFRYDEVGNLVEVTDAENGTASYEFDLVGRMTEVTNPNGNSTSYDYDPLGRLLEEIDPLGNVTNYAYDDNGNVVSRTDAEDRETEYSYDELNRPLTSVYPDGSQVEAAYDEVGNLSSTTNDLGTTTFSYDNRNRLTMETLPDGRTLEREYDDAGNSTAFVYPDGSRTTYRYNAANQLTSVADPFTGVETTYEYDERGLPASISYPNNVIESYRYDPMGRVTRITDAKRRGSVLNDLMYEYDKNSNPTNITDRDGAEAAFTYDSLDRLVSESYGSRSFEYNYDPSGNRTSMDKITPNGMTTTDYSYDDAEQMTSAGNATYTYDDNGNLTSKTIGSSTTDYAYDFEDRMVSAGATDYAYDPFGRRVSSQTGATETSYLFDGSQVVQEDSDSANARYARGLGGSLISRRQGEEGSPSYYGHDAIGSTTALISSSGRLTDSYAYTAFGQVRGRTGTSSQPFTYLGNTFEKGTGLYDFHARQYDYSTGRFTSEDPIKGLVSLPQTLNPYVCSVNNPLAHPDPGGMFPVTLDDDGSVVPVAKGHYLNDRALEKLPDTGGGENCPPPADEEGGYVDVNVSGGVGVGLTGGFQFYSKGFYPYLGGGLVFGVGGSITQAPEQSPSPGLNVGAQGTYGGAVNVGRSFGECGVPLFFEGGGGLPISFQATAYYVTDFSRFVQAYYESVPYPLYAPAP